MFFYMLLFYFKAMNEIDTELDYLNAVIQGQYNWMYSITCAAFVKCYINFVTILIDTSSHSLAWDVSTSNGQAAIGVIADKLNNFSMNQWFQ